MPLRENLSVHHPLQAGHRRRQRRKPQQNEDGEGRQCPRAYDDVQTSCKEACADDRRSSQKRRDFYQHVGLLLARVTRCPGGLQGFQKCAGRRLIESEGMYAKSES